jgi:type IV secretory pathway TraG/TraD family ATPase VirD4
MHNIDSARAKYIDKFLENAKLIRYREIDPSSYRVRRIFYNELQNEDLTGYYPFASEYVSLNYTPVAPGDDGLLCYHFLPNFHELYIGTTGSGKTTGCVEPQLRAISTAKNKPNIFLTDPKGELFERNAKHLRKQGYNLYLLNFKDNLQSDRWNPLLEVYDAYQQLNQIGTDYLYLTGKPSRKYECYDEKAAYKKDYIAYRGYAFANYSSFESFVTYERDKVFLKVEDLVTQICNMIIYVRSTKDPTWEEGANRLLKGLIYSLLEDSLDPALGFQRDMMSFKSIRDLYNTLRRSFSSNDNEPFILTKHEPFRHKKPDAYSIELMRQACENAPNTTRSYLGVYETSVQNWMNLKILSLTTGHTIDIEHQEKPFAVFLITRDYEKSDFTVAGLFIDWVYRKSLEYVERHGMKRETHFILDEFGNIPQIRDFENKISTARSRGIWFHLVIQSYSQLSHVYDTDNASQKSEIIKDNCNAQVFLGAQNHDTKERFSRECGDHSILTFDSSFGQGQNHFDRVRLLPASKLDLLKPGIMFIKRLGMPVIESTFVRSYLVNEFKVDNFGGFKTVKPNGSSYNDRQYRYGRLFGEKEEDDEFNI